MTVILAVFLIYNSPVMKESAEGFNPRTADGSIGTGAPDFSIEDLSGDRVSLSSFRGKPVLLNFWATWCPYCRKERSHLNSLYQDYKDKGLIILSVSTDRKVEKVKQYLKKMPADFMVLSDRKGGAASTYNVIGLPTSYLINSEGIIKHKITGYLDWSDSQSRKLIDGLIND
jgi:peroxiredoxin